MKLVLLQTLASERTLWYPLWIIYVILFCILLLGLVRILNSELISGIFSSLITRPNSNTNFREVITLMGRTFWIMIFNYVLISSVFMLLIQNLYIPDSNFLWILFPSGLLCFNFVSFVSIGLISGHFSGIRENIHIFHMIHQLFGIVLIPLTVCLLLFPNHILIIIWIASIVYFILIIIRFYRGISYALANNIVWYYIILYLCTLEILPLGIIYKLV